MLSRRLQHLVEAHLLLEKPTVAVVAERVGQGGVGGGHGERPWFKSHKGEVGTGKVKTHHNSFLLTKKRLRRLINPAIAAPSPQNFFWPRFSKTCRMNFIDSTVDRDVARQEFFRVEGGRESDRDEEK